MINLKSHIILSCLLIKASVFLGNTSINPVLSNFEIDKVFTELENEILACRQKYDLEISIVLEKIQTLNSGLIEESTDQNKVASLIEKSFLRDRIDSLRLKEASDISKIRYIKGLEIIRILYDKTLALDHHFSSVTTLSAINKISNPNDYTEFQKVRQFLGEKKDRKNGFDLTNILGNNIYTSITHSLISLFNNERNTKEEKEMELEQVECILDFTLNIHNDLNTIYFETIFLEKNNENILKAIQQLFIDFTKPIGYNETLVTCRSTDDWDTVRDKLNLYMEDLETIQNDPSQKRKILKMQINLEFPIDRLLHFITQYNAFIDQGAKFYEKFEIMLNSYENEQTCHKIIPNEYTKLKESITITIEKFNTAYKPIEINGSKMKEILYGINEYD